jgi:hypothetical protein
MAAPSTLPGIQRAGVLSTRRASAETGIPEHTLNRVAVACEGGPGVGGRLTWSWRDIEALRIAQKIAEAGAGDGFPVIARAVLYAHALGAEPVLAGWVAYRDGEIRYGATPSEALGPLTGAVVAWLKPPKEHRP